MQLYRKHIIIDDDGHRGFSVDQLKEKKLTSTFQLNVLVVFRAKKPFVLALKTEPHDYCVVYSHMFQELRSGVSTPYL